MTQMRIRRQVGLPAGPPHLGEDELLFDPRTRQLLYVDGYVKYVIPWVAESLKTYEALIEIDHDVEQATYLLGAPGEDDFGVVLLYHSQGFTLTFTPLVVDGRVALGIEAESAPYLDEDLEPVSAAVTWEEEAEGRIRFDVLVEGAAVNAMVYVRMGFEAVGAVET